MADLESSAKALAEALDALETRLDQRLHDIGNAEEMTALLRRQTRAAQAFTSGAAEDLNRAIGDLKALLSDTPGRGA